MTVLDPAGLEAAARVIEGPFPTVAEEAASADLAAAAVSAYLAALPVPSDAENPWRDRPGLTETHDERKERRAKCEGFHRGFAAGRAAAHPYPPDDCPADTPMGSCVPRCGDARCEAAATPDPRVPSGLPIGYGGPTVKTDPVALLARIKAVVDEPLDERIGYGPTRTEQFARIDALLNGIAPAASPDPPRPRGDELVTGYITGDEESLRFVDAMTPEEFAKFERRIDEAFADPATPAASPDERLREALAWIAEYGERNGDLRTGHLQAVKHIARNALGLEPDLPLAAADREAPDGGAGTHAPPPDANGGSV